MREFAHAEVVDDEQGHGGQVGEVGLARAVERRVRNLLDQRVRFAVDDAIALLDGGPADGLREVALAGAGRAEEERVFAPLDKSRGGEIVDQRAVHLLVEIEIKRVEGTVGVPKAGLLVPTRKEAVLAPLEFVGDERRDKVERREVPGLGLPQPDVKDIGHA